VEVLKRYLKNNFKNKNIGKGNVPFYIHVGHREGNEVVRFQRFIYRVCKIMA
jgi:hypothetical protein